MFSDIITGISHLSATLTDITGLINKNVKSYRDLHDTAKLRSDIKKWRDLLSRLHRQRQMQVCIPGTIRSYADRGDCVGALDYMIAAFDEIHQQSAEIRSILEKHGQDLMVADDKLYTGLIDAENARSLFKNLVDAKPNLSPDDLRSLADIYSGLIAEMSDFRSAFAEFIAVNENTAKTSS